MSRKAKTSELVLLMICALYFVLYIDRVNIGTAADGIRRELGLTNMELGIAFSAFATPYAITQFFGGWFADRFGARATLTLFGVIFSAATILTGFVHSLGSLVACRTLLGLGEAPALPTATRAMANWTPVARWGFAQGITHSSARIGTAVTPPLIAAMILWTSWRGSFVIVGCVTLLWVATWFLYFRNNPADHRGVTPAELASLPPVDRQREKARVPVVRLLLRMLPVTLVDFCYAWTLWVYLNWMPSFFLQNYGLTLKDSALFSAGVLCAGIVGDTLGGIVSDRLYRATGDLRVARRNLIAAGLLGSLVFLVPVLLFKDLTIVSICLTLAFFSMELVIAPLWSVPMDIAPRFAGTASGFMNVGFGIAGILSPLAFGKIIDLTGDWHLPFALSIGLLLLGAVMTYWMKPDKAFVDVAPLVRAPA